MHKLFAKLALSVLLLSFATLLLAQNSSSLIGVVTDANGAVIPDTVVTLSNPSTGVSYAQKSDGTGTYRFLVVPPNPGYKVTFAHAGFANAEVSGIALSVGITRTQNIKLVPGNVETVKVSATNEVVTLDTTTATIGNNIDVDQLNTLPIYDRTAGITTLFYQQAGVTHDQGAVTGARIDQSSVTVDGMDVNDIAAGTTFSITTTAPVDSVEQFTGSVAGLSAANSTGSGAQFQIITKGGTNKFHGNVNEYHRDTTTVANTWFNNLTGLPRTPLIRNQFGGNASGPIKGGPIKTNKLFFFFDIAASKIVQSASAERTVPLAAFRAGTLNYINSGAGCGDITRITNLTSLPACITTLSAGQLATLDPAGTGFNTNMKAFVDARYPVANDASYGDGVNTAGYRFTTPTPNNQTTYVGRIDYNLSPTQKIYGRFTINRENAIETLPEFNTDPITHPFIDRSYGYVVSHTWNIGKYKVNQFYYGDSISKLSFPDTYNPTGGTQYNYISGLSGPYTDFDGQKRRVPIPMVRDDFSWQHGAHSLTMGGTFKFIKTNSNLTSNFNYPEIGLYGAAFGGALDPSVRPGNIATGGAGNASNVAVLDYDNLFASSLGVIGYINTNFVYDNKGVAQPAGSGEQRAYRYFETEMYFGDTWKVNKKLTLSYGMRYQLYSVPYETHGDESVSTNIDLNTYMNFRKLQSASGDSSNDSLPLFSYVLGGKANHGPNLYAPSYTDIAPRVAFSYTPFDSQKTVINGSAGIVYDRTVINAINFLQDQISYLFFNSNNNQIGSNASGGNSAAYESLLNDPRVGAGLSYSAALNPPPSPIATPYTPYVDGDGVPNGLELGETSFVISPTLKDPYSIALNFGVQQDIPFHMVLKANYVGRLGRRLLADVDASQVMDVPDYTGGSTQTMIGAFADLTAQLRAGKTYHNVTPEPWFEDISGAITHSGTAYVAKYAGTYVQRGDISDALNTLAYYSYNFGTGWLPTNIGIPSQFGTNAYLTNMGSSNYHALLLTLDKNMSQGLRFEFNYTWSHSIDNTSLTTNNNALFSNTGMICDYYHPRACRGNSDFDIRQEISSNFLYELPVGRGKMFLSNLPRWQDNLIGGWSISGLPSYRTGTALTAYSDAYLASFDNADPAIFTGNKNDLKVKVNTDHTTNIVYSFAGGAAGANKVLNEFRGPLGLEYGQRNMLRGPGAFFLDAGLAKNFPIFPDKLNLKFRADAYNVLNHPAFRGSGSLNIVNNASAFGQITDTTGANGSSTASPARVAQFSLRLEF
jgi:hypothetical protein